MTEENMEKKTSAPKRRGSVWTKALWLTGAVGIVVAGFLVFPLDPSPKGVDEAAQTQAGKQSGMPVEAIEVVTAPIKRRLSAVGTLKSDESVVVSAEIAGRVTEVPFEEGDRVEAGQILLRLDDSVLKAELDRAEASLGLSRANYKRAEALLKDNAISERERDEAYARWQLDEATLRLTRANLEKTVIHAPFAGRLGLRDVSPGSYLRPGDAIVNLDAVDPIKVDFRVPEGFARQVKVGQTLDVSVDAVPGRDFPGEVVAIAPRFDAEGRSMLLRARLDNDRKMLSPGMFARVSLVLEQRAEALMIPEEALVARGDGQLVYKVVDGKVEAAPVKLGVRQKGRVEIREGVAAGETVITAGHLKVRPGMPVTVLPAVADGAKPSKNEG